MKKIKLKECAQRYWKIFCCIFFRKKNAFRDLIILSSLILIMSLAGFFSSQVSKNSDKSEVIGESEVVLTTLPASDIEQKKEDQMADIQLHTNISQWISYQNLWFGFSLKYPDGWLDPVTRTAPSGATWEGKIQFRRAEIDETDPLEGFDVTIYRVAKIKEVKNTDEFPKIKSQEMSNRDECNTIEGHLLETGSYAAEEIYIPIQDDCYNATLFFSNTRGGYIYNISPKIKDGAGLAGDPYSEIATHLPEFFSVAATWELIDIQRPQKNQAPTPIKPKIADPLPLTFTTVNGQRVCEKKNDHPAKSTKHKGRHLDMECCLDPDEYPNANCYYPPDKYGKYL